MKSDSWFFVILRSFHPIRTIRVEKRLFLFLGIGGVLLAGLLGLGIYRHYSLFLENTNLKNETRQLRLQVSNLQQTLSQVAAEHFPPLKIDELQVVWPPKGTGFAARFKLTQSNPEGPPYSGTLVMVAKNEKLRPPVYRVIPEMPLEKGIPRQPEKGKPFEVKGQRFVEALFDNNPEEVFHSLTVFVFSPEGKLILQKTAEIPKA
ncbi:MAG: hypothetical protein HXY45_13415 [Syntrophaceae bacterium]|jgi:hypothetical protein|nr:hypothetical protein [Syntrophaceae bacterium]